MLVILDAIALMILTVFMISTKSFDFMVPEWYDKGFPTTYNSIVDMIDDEGPDDR